MHGVPNCQHAAGVCCACSPLQHGDHFFAESVPCEVRGATFKVSTTQLQAFQEPLRAFGCRSSLVAATSCGHRDSSSLALVASLHAIASDTGVQLVQPLTVHAVSQKVITCRPTQPLLVLAMALGTSVRLLQTICRTVMFVLVNLSPCHDGVHCTPWHGVTAELISLMTH